MGLTVLTGVPGIGVNAGDPNGSVSGAIGSVIRDSTNGKLWINSTGSTVWLALVRADLVSGGGQFGDGSDGAATFDGSTAVTGCTRSGSTYTATRDLFYTTGTFSNGVVLDTAPGCRVFFNTSLVGPSSGSATIKCDGNAASGATGGTGFTANGSTTGTTSGTGASGIQNAGQAAAANGSVPTSWRSGVGGTGGTDGGGTHAGGAGGAFSTTLADTLGSLNTWVQASLGRIGMSNAGIISGGTGGGSGGGTTGVASGGGGGAGGGIMIVGAKSVTNGANITISANGGAGGAGQGGVAGGGGGGGGGQVVFGHGGSTTPSGMTITAAGGSGGAGVSTGATGSPGGSGKTLVFNMGIS